MLYGKINPQAEHPTQTSPFGVDIQYAQYMTAMATPYPLGAENVAFLVQFGNVTFENGVPVLFNAISSISISLDSTQIADWGLDDSVVLGEIATAIGTTVTETINF